MRDQTIKVFLSVPQFSFDPEADAEILTLSALSRAALRLDKDLRIIPFQGQPGLFLTEPLVVEALDEEGDDALPITLRGQELLLKGRAPTKEELCEWLEIDNIDLDLEREAAIQMELSQARGCGTACGSSCNMAAGCVSCPSCKDAFLADEDILNMP
ncbi:MAG: arsenic metallochaperone ArsD family protein [Eubacteriales bacterium]|nr:arsenic metallochaperone ArsD family protein [Eubacteriales bacterium]